MCVHGEGPERGGGGGWGGGGGGVDVLLHLGDVWKGPEGEMVLGRVLVSGNPKIVYFGLKWTILDGVMPRLDVARELKRHTSFAAAIGGRKRLDGRKARARVVVEGKARKNSNIPAHAFQEYSGGGGSASTRHSDYSENIAKLGNDSRRDKTTHAEETGTYKTIDRSDK
ncbi:hypothetical protein B0H14DRAFT_2610241 [Mycena olivaceomarginata]|nr:hypothetical protein B0H14DRAFT_2610241 [Mycena olivaceomarginata]